jgi:hypothetical protein
MLVASERSIAFHNCTYKLLESRSEKLAEGLQACEGRHETARYFADNRLRLRDEPD